MTHYDVLIVGGGHAGALAAIALRQAGFAGTVDIVNAEPELPYERPPLSKNRLAGGKPFARSLIRPAAFRDGGRIDMLLGQSVVAVDPDAHRVTTDDGPTIVYGTLIWATGGAARRLGCAGHDLAGVHSVRSRADVNRMIGELPQVTRVVVIGGGYIGLGAAAVLAKRGKQGGPIRSDDQAEPLATTLSSGWMHDLLDYDLRPTPAQVKCPTLSLNGSKDGQVLPGQNLPTIRAATRGNPNVTLVELPNLNHLFQAAKTGASGEYADIEETIAPIALDTMAAWLAKHVDACASRRIDPIVAIPMPFTVYQLQTPVHQDFCGRFRRSRDGSPMFP